MSDSGPNTPQLGESATTPERLHELFLAHANSRDLQGMMDLYAGECAGGDLEANFLPDRAAIAEFVGGFLDIVKELRAVTRKCIVAGDIALLSSEWHAVVEAEDGHFVEATGTSAEVARRQSDGSWRFVIDDPIFAS